MKRAPCIDVSGLPTYAFGSRDPVWWGVVLMIAIETTVFGLVAASYFFVRDRYAVWPPTGITPSARLLESAVMGLLLLSAAPMLLVNRAARRLAKGPTRGWLIVATALGMAAIVIRLIALGRIGFRWDSHAYGSVVYSALWLHAGHMIAGTAENAVFVALLFRRPVEKKLFVDVDLNGLYWYFVVFAWAPLYAILFLEHVLLGP